MLEYRGVTEQGNASNLIHCKRHFLQFQQDSGISSTFSPELFFACAVTLRSKAFL